MTGFDPPHRAGGARPPSAHRFPPPQAGGHRPPPPHGGGHDAPALIRDRWLATGSERVLGRAVGPVVYRDRLIGTRPVLAAVVIVLLGMGAGLLEAVVLESAPVDVRFVAVLIPLALAGALIAHGSNHGITLYGDRLRVGRHVVPLAWLEPGSVQAALTKPPLTEFDLAEMEMPRIDKPIMRSRDGEDHHVLGGGFGVPTAARSVVVRDRWGRALLIPCGDHRAFLQALLGALGATPPVGPPLR